MRGRTGLQSCEQLWDEDESEAQGVWGGREGPEPSEAHLPPPAGEDCGSGSFSYTHQKQAESRGGRGSSGSPLSRHRQGNWTSLAHEAPEAKSQVRTFER